jgi:signal transduction histidine kinase
MRLIPKSKIVIHRKIAWLLVFSVLSLMVVSWLIYVSKRNIGKTSSGINRTYEIIGTIQHLMLTVSESGSDSYRYLENGDRQAALRLQSSHAELQQGLDSLQRFTRKNCDQDANINLLYGYIRAKTRYEDSLLAAPSFTPAATPPAPRSTPSPAAYQPASNPGSLTTVERRLSASDSSLKAFLNTMIIAEKSLLAERKQLNDEANRRTAYGALVGRIAGCLFVVIVLINLNKDISQRKKAQEQLEIAMREAQEAKQMQEQFLANMSHEIRTPMNGIKGMTDLLLSTPLSGKQHELAGIIKSAVNNLLVIVGDILDFSKIKAGKLNIEKIRFRLNDVLGNATAIFDHRLKKKHLSLETIIDPAIPDWLIGDPHRLNQILINLLGNAIKFTDQGQIQIQVTLREHTESGVLLSFTVRDTGIGITPDSLPYIFESFAQGGRDTSRLYGGTGLGLTICKQLLHLQGGDITVTSAIGKGSAFQFHLPYDVSTEMAADRPATEVIYDYSKLLAGKRFLVAEDNEINQKLIDYVLRKAGGTVEMFNNGAEAIRHLQQDKVFDLIIMDLQMPEMDGYTATRYIRNDLKMQTPIIAMTATAMKGEQLQCIESGMNEYMTKPFEFAELYKRIGILLS